MLPYKMFIYSNMPDLVPHHYYYPFNDSPNHAVTVGVGTKETKENSLSSVSPSSSSKLPPSHLRDALVKEEDENSSDNVEKAPKRKKNKGRDIIKPDPKYKGEYSWLNSQSANTNCKS